MTIVQAGPQPLSPPVFRFAPSPNGYLHLGHAYSALLNQRMARDAGGRLLLRIEDIDLARCRPEYVQAIYEDLEWLGLEWETPVRRQSEHFDDYALALGRLIKAGLVYSSWMTRAEAAKLSNTGKVDPLGVPHHPLTERNLDQAIISQRQLDGIPFAWRLNMEKAAAAGPPMLSWSESGPGQLLSQRADPAAWGDVVIARKETPTSYHLSVVVDDALQGVTDVVRGMDLFSQTSVHRLLQELLGLPTPRYHHHRLIVGADGEKLAKRAASTPLRLLRQQGITSGDIRKALGF
jgi:glutamyl-Q tRNA(Asp) synthetase